jgi:hypothetical protein
MAMPTAVIFADWSNRPRIVRREHLDARRAVVEAARRPVGAGGELEVLRLELLRLALRLGGLGLERAERLRVEVAAELGLELVALGRAGADLVERLVVVAERLVVDLEVEALDDRLARLALEPLLLAVELLRPGRVEAEPDAPEDLAD